MLYIERKIEKKISLRERKNEDMKMSREAETKDRERAPTTGFSDGFSSCFSRPLKGPTALYPTGTPASWKTHFHPTHPFSLKLVLTGFCFLQSKQSPRRPWAHLSSLGERQLTCQPLPMFSPRRFYRSWPTVHPVSPIFPCTNSVIRSKFLHPYWWRWE